VRIESEVERVKREVEKDMSEEGRKLAHAVGVYNLDPEITDTLGRLKFRYSYGQNQLIATLETAKIGRKIAQEIGADFNVATLGSLLHDIGKVIADKEGTHVQLGVEFLKKKNMPQAVIDCVAQHHEDEPFTSVESKIVHIADAISGARPGARHESVQDYIKRLSDLEQIALSQKGVDKAYAFAAGREVWVIVKPEEVSDDQLTKLSHDISNEIETKMSFPGQVTVTVIREKRVEANTFAHAA
jgi:ribonuclease Y